MPSSARTFFNFSRITGFQRSIPRARDSTTSTSENLSTTMPGRKSASPKIRRQLPVSTVVFLYSQAFRTRISIKSSSMTASRFRDMTRTVILERVLMKPCPRKYPSKSTTSTMSPFSKFPEMDSISLS